jgi:hypothetical protein
MVIVISVLWLWFGALWLWLVNCDRLIVNGWLWLVNCDRLIANGSLWLVNCDRLIVNGWLWLVNCDRLIVNGWLWLGHIVCAWWILIVIDWLCLVICDSDWAGCDWDWSIVVFIMTGWLLLWSVSSERALGCVELSDLRLVHALLWLVNWLILMA